MWQLLKIERVSATGIKQTCISDVCFASLTLLPESESSLPKLSFPEESPRKKEKVSARLDAVIYHRFNDRC